MCTPAPENYYVQIYSGTILKLSGPSFKLKGLCDPPIQMYPPPENHYPAPVEQWMTITCVVKFSYVGKNPLWGAGADEKPWMNELNGALWLAIATQCH